MKNRHILTATAMGLAIAACSQTAKLGVRSIGQNAMQVAANSTLAQGRALYARQEYALAIEKFNQVVREAPDKPEGYNALAASYDMLERYDVSRRYYELALSRAPADGRIYRNMARSLRMQGREGEALAVLAEWNALVKDGVAVAEATPAPMAGTAQPVVTALSEPKPAEPSTQPKPLPVEASSVVAVVAPADVARARTSATIDIPAAVPASAPAQAAAPVAPSYRSATAAIRIMNGVGKRGLARGVQTWLAQSGWSQSRTGDLDTRYSRSYLVFPKAAQADAISLSKSLPFPTGKVVNERASRIVLILGRNAAGVDFRSVPVRPAAG